VLAIDPGTSTCMHRIQSILRVGSPQGLAVAEVYVVVVEVCGGAVVQVCGGGVSKVIQTQNSNGTRH
jgi:hypothetical protein